MPRLAALRPGVAGLLAFAGLAVAACGLGGGPVEHRGEAREHVAGTVALPPAECARRLAGHLPAALVASSRFAGLAVARSGDEIFPPDEQLRLRSADNPALAAYSRLSPEARRDDLYLFDLSDRFWRSAEYTRGGVPLRFESDFILHLQAAPSGGTSIEVIEYLPRLDLGKRFHLRGRHGPDLYQEIRFVAPTTEDRVQLLTLVRELLASAVEPGADGSAALPRDPRSARGR